LQRLPPFTRRDWVEAGDALYCKSCPPAHGRVAPSSTSGSTGEPVTVRRSELCQLHWMANTLREHLWHGRDFSGRLAVVRANATKPLQNRDWGSPCNLLLDATGPASVLPPYSSVEETVRWLVDFKPDSLLMLPSVLGACVLRMERTGQRLPGLCSVRTLSETVPARLREDVRRVLGLGIHDVYSSQEGGVMATQCPEQARYHVAETILLEVVDAEGQPCTPGQAGRILVTDLINFATPVIRYEIGDHAETGGPCPCGRGMPTVERFLGRERSLVLLPDGSRHWPTVGFHRWEQAFAVRQFQFTQLDRHTIEARMSAEGRPTPEQEDRLTTLIQESLGHPFVIRYHWQQEPLPRGPGGKFEEFLCLAR
jgi:phenylacetate-CoA ligase